MAAVLATALSFGPAVAARSGYMTAPARPRPLVCRWVLDPVNGKLVCAWEPAPDSPKPILHLRLVHG